MLSRRVPVPDVVPERRAQQVVLRPRELPFLRGAPAVPQVHARVPRCLRPELALRALQGRRGEALAT